MFHYKTFVCPVTINYQNNQKRKSRKFKFDISSIEDASVKFWAQSVYWKTTFELLFFFLEADSKKSLNLCTKFFILDLYFYLNYLCTIQSINRLSLLEMGSGLISSNAPFR